MPRARQRNWSGRGGDRVADLFYWLGLFSRHDVEASALFAFKSSNCQRSFLDSQQISPKDSGSASKPGPFVLRFCKQYIRNLYKIVSPVLSNFSATKANL